MSEKMLLIAPVFFNYYKEIIKEATELGYDVDYVCDAPSNSNISKAIGRINKKLIEGNTKKYYTNIVLPLIKDKPYKKVLVIAGMTFAFTPQMIDEIRQMNSNAKFVIYQWDSEKNLPYVKSIHKYFDELYSFDRHDCKINSKYNFLPLFYTRIYEEIGKNSVDKFKYDCSYVGTAHPQKYKDINMMSEQLKSILPHQFIYHYMPSKLKYLYHKLFAEEFKKAKWSDFGTNKISTIDLMEIFRNSKCILDAPQAGQKGLTIRTIECLGAKRKLITTNKDVVNYDFFKPEDIYVYEGVIDKENIFFKAEFKEIEKNIYAKYSLKNWIIKMLG